VKSGPGGEDVPAGAATLSQRRRDLFPDQLNPDTIVNALGL
jgi:hypothetical protein